MLGTAFRVALEPDVYVVPVAGQEPEGTAVLELAELQGAIQTVSDPTAVMQRVVDQAMELIPSAEGAVIAGAMDGHLTYLCAAGTLAAHEGMRTPLERSLVGAALRTGETLRCDDTSGDGRVDPARSRRVGAGSAVCVPLKQGTETIGVLAVVGSRPSAFGAGDAATLTRLAGFITVAIGAMWNLARITTELFEGLRADAGPAPGDECEGADGWRPEAGDRIGHFVANVLRPGVVAELAARQRIERVLADDGLTMRCQPIVRLESGDLVGAEALARFPEGPQSADVWFSDAERLGLGVELQLAAVERAVGLIDALPAGAYLTINVGPDVVAAPGLAELLGGVDAERIVLELTEHLQIQDYPRLQTGLSTIRGRGTRLAVDDTGAGFSSLIHIVNLGPDLIKLDRQFTRGIDTDPVRRALAQALVSFARETGAEVVSEGIETAEELRAVQRLGIPYGQGYYIGRPTSAALITRHYAHAGPPIAPDVSHGRPTAGHGRSP